MPTEYERICADAPAHIMDPGSIRSMEEDFTLDNDSPKHGLVVPQLRAHDVGLAAANGFIGVGASPGHARVTVWIDEPAEEMNPQVFIGLGTLQADH